MPWQIGVKKTNDIYSLVRILNDPHEAWNFWHTARTDMFKNHPMTPVPPDRKNAFSEIELFDYNPKFRIAVDLKPSNSKNLKYDLGEDGTTEVKSHAITNGLAKHLGSELEVYWIGGYGGGLFIPFKDKTSGVETYGGGRYLIDAIKGSDLGLDIEGRLILDFNFAYNPSCSMSDAYVCPLAPPGNTLPSAIRAGEKMQSWV